jgi:CYTH domain-containing protein
MTAKTSGVRVKEVEVSKMTLEEIYRLAGIDVKSTYEKKYLIEMIDLDMLKHKYSTEIIYVERTYLRQTSEGIERVIKHTSDIDTGTSSPTSPTTATGESKSNTKSDRYYYIENCSDIDIYKDDIEKQISLKDYNRLKQEKKEGTHSLKRKRVKFIYNGTYFEIDIYPFWDNKAILKLERSSENNDNITLPKEIKVLEDITNNTEYKQKNLAVNLGNI